VERTEGQTAAGKLAVDLGDAERQALGFPRRPPLKFGYPLSEIVDYA
jgi:hypothetical protein